jgi:hypothetical protein
MPRRRESRIANARREKGEVKKPARYLLRGAEVGWVPGERLIVRRELTSQERLSVDCLGCHLGHPEQDAAGFCCTWRRRIKYGFQVRMPPNHVSLKRIDKEVGEGV